MKHKAVITIEIDPDDPSTADITVEMDPAASQTVDNHAGDVALMMVRSVSPAE